MSSSRQRYTSKISKEFIGGGFAKSTSSSSPQMHLLRRSIALVEMTFLQQLHVFRIDAGRSWVATFAVLLSRHVVLEKSEGVSR